MFKNSYNLTRVKLSPFSYTQLSNQCEPHITLFYFIAHLSSPLRLYPTEIQVDVDGVID